MTTALDRCKVALDAAVRDRANWIEPPLDDAHALAVEAVENFVAAGPALLDDATSHLWRYYRSIREEFTEADRVAYGIPEIGEGTDIWEHVSFGSSVDFAEGHGPLAPGRCYLSFEGEVTWEREHGLQLVFEEGNKLCKVGPYDGHMTNAHAYADPALLNVVFT